MQETEQATTATAKSTWNGIERRRVEKVVEALATLRSPGESLSEVAHDARNMVTALGLYCDLLAEPGVLATGFLHYSDELRLVASASRRLVEKLVALDASAITGGSVATLPEACVSSKAALPIVHAPHAAASEANNVAQRTAARPGANLGNSSWEASGRSSIASATTQERNRRWDLLPALPITNLAAELLANRNLLAALAGPSVALTVETAGGAQAVRLTGEDLTRLLVNLVKNAAEAMSQGGRIHLGLREHATAGGAADCLELTIADNGPGIPLDALDKIFTSGYTSRSKEATAGSWPQSHRGLGLAIVRSIVEGAGGRIQAANRAQGGACFTLEIPVRKNRE